MRLNCGNSAFMHASFLIFCFGNTSRIAIQHKASFKDHLDVSSLIGGLTVDMQSSLQYLSDVHRDPSMVSSPQIWFHHAVQLFIM